VRAVPGFLALLLALATSRAWVSLRPGWLSLEARLVDPAQPVLPDGSLSAAFTPEVQGWAPEILRWAHEQGLSPDLVGTVMQIESCGYAQATSPSGARGLFQVMPFHFVAAEDGYDPETNARRGLAYLSEALRLADGRVDRALAGYNAGHSALWLPPAEWPAETERYVYWGAGILDDIAAGRIPSPRLEEWLSAGGARLCAEARAGTPGLP
jgi:soluble lytic murein transglycosylase-like protein